MRLFIKNLLLVMFMLTISIGTFSQEVKKTLGVADYPKWSRIVSTSLSDDGNWMTYSYRPNDGDDTLYIKNIESGKLYSDRYCSNPDFSSDSKWIVYQRNLTKKESDKLRKSKKEVYIKGVLMNLETGKKNEWDKIKSIAFSPSSNFMVIKKENDNKEIDGSDLLIKNLSDNKIMNIGNVSDFKFNKQGTLLAYIIDADSKAGNGVYLMDLLKGNITPLDTDTASYSQLTWDDEMLYRSEWGSKGTALAVLKGNTTDTTEQRINSLLLFTGLNSAKTQQKAYNPVNDKNFPEGYILSEKSGLSFSTDNNRLVIGIKEQSKKEKLSRDTISNVDVWHWDDEDIQSVQMLRASREKNSTYTAILHLDKMNFVQLSSDDMRYISLNRNADQAIGGDPKPYISDTNWGGGFSDYYLIDTKTGSKKLIEKKVGRSMGLSPQGTQFLFFKEGHFFAYDLIKKNLTNISKAINVSFIDINEDHPYENPSYGVAGWSKDGKSVYLNHLYDIWAVALDGSGGYNLTGNYGSDNEIHFRIESPNGGSGGFRSRVTSPQEDPYIDLTKAVYLSAYGEWTKKSGYFKLKDGKTPQELIFADYSFGRLNKATKADRFLFSRESFVDFPDYYTSDSKFNNIVKQTNANPQQAEYKWGSRTLVEFKNKQGDRLQGTLTLPANYEKGKKYPMLVYFYEKVSDQHNRYSMPAYDDRPHMSEYASDGYLVLMPDIKYYVGQPGWNALDCVTSAVKKVIELGYADPDHIGMQGHSWGGYQSSFILTQTDMFACVVTGAPVTNLTSMYNILYKNSGTNNQGIFELGQVRMGKGMFDDMQNYIDQSPVQNAQGIKTPFMILQGTVDGAVDWNQGLEFYNAARRLGKKVIFLSYPDENHHLANKNNQIDFQIRMKQFFDHYLKGTEAPEWMEKGIKQQDKLYNKAK